MCLKKDPPINTILKVGENITQYRWKHGLFWCDDCNRTIGKRQREKSKGIYIEYERQKREEDIEEFDGQWNDPEFKGMKETADKLVAVFNKYGRRSRDKGLEKEIICAVIFKDEWNVDVVRVIEDILNTRDAKPMARMRYKEVFFMFSPAIIDAFREYYRMKARNKWEGIVDAINHKYAGVEKIVAKPEYKDPRTKQHYAKWYLLSHEDELEQRNQMNERKKDRIDYNMKQEAQVVERQEAKEQEILEKERQKQERSKDDDKDEKSNEGGE